MSAETYMQSLRTDAEAASIATWEVDVVVHDRETGRLGARILLSARAGVDKTTDENAASIDQSMPYPQHLIWVLRSGKIAEIRTITDTDVLPQNVQDSDPLPRSLGRDQQHMSSPDLAQFYTAYIRCINQQTMKTDLHKYCHSVVSWCGRGLPIDEYRSLMEDSFEAISGLVFGVRDLIVDEERQQICSRIEFTGTPVRSYAGVEPTGKPVKFAEHAIYWLEAGKIAKVVTVIDWQSYRKQLSP
jgi:predicted ester cyclase